jgi:hypothetical protein
MRRLVCVALVGFLLAAASGCAQLSKEVVVGNQIVVKGLTEDRSMTESHTEHLHRMTAIVNQDARGLIDDWDVLLLRDRPGRLARWYSR